MATPSAHYNDAGSDYGSDFTVEEEQLLTQLVVDAERKLASLPVPLAAIPDIEDSYAQPPNPRSSRTRFVESNTPRYGDEVAQRNAGVFANNSQLPEVGYDRSGNPQQQQTGTHWHLHVPCSAID